MQDEKMQDETQTSKEPEETPGFGEREAVPGGFSVGDAVPEMPPPDNQAAAGGGLTADDLAQPTTTADTTGDRATGLTALRG